MAVTWASALSWRLRRHHLDGERAERVEEVVDRLVAIPDWLGDAGTAIRLRLANSPRDEPARAIADGRVFATYAFRGATHLMTPESASVHLALRCAGRQWERSSWRSYYRLEPEDWPRLRETVRDALRDGPLTHHELASAVTRDPLYRHLMPAFEDRSHTFLKPFCWQGDVCFDRSEGAYVLRLLESVPGWTGLADLDDAGPRAIRAYLGAYGPATRDRIDYWLGEGLSAGRRRIAGWVERMKDELVTLSIDGEEALCLAEYADAVAGTTESEQVVLIPGFDQWILGAGTSETRIVPSSHRPLATRGANLVLVGGRVHGTWRVDHETIRVEWLDAAASDPSSVATAVDRLSAALGRELTIAAR